jgi:hypothetical protein
VKKGILKIRQDTYKFLNHTPPAQGGNLKGCWQEILMTLQGVQQTLLLEMGYFQQEIICSLYMYKLMYYHKKFLFLGILFYNNAHHQTIKA